MIGRIKHIAKQKGYQIYQQPFKLNIWGFRSKNELPNKFDDEFHVFFNTREGLFPKWAYFVFKCTTDPGTYWLKNPMHPQGTAAKILKLPLSTIKTQVRRARQNLIQSYKSKNGIALSSGSIS